MAISPLCDGEPVCTTHTGLGTKVLTGDPLTPPEPCPNEVLPHSDRCLQAGGQLDYENFLEMWRELLDEPCQCVLGEAERNSVIREDAR